MAETMRHVGRATRVRGDSSLARLLSESSLPLLERAVGPVVEEVARIIAGSASSPVTVRTRLTQADRRRGRTGGKGKRSSISLPNACRICGVVLSTNDREYCDECLPAFKQERTEKLAKAGRRALAEMRASSNDPAKSSEARARRSAALTRQQQARRAWELEHGAVFDQERYETEILPLVTAMTVPQLASITGLSRFYCWQVRRGEKRLHPRHWDGVVKFGAEGLRGP